MDKYEEIEGGWMTVRRISILIDENIRTAQQFELKLSWTFIGTKIRSQIKRGGKVIFERFYEGKHTHIHIAELHVDFEERLHLEIKNKIEQNKIAERIEKEKAADSKPTMLEAAQREKFRNMDK